MFAPSRTAAGAALGERFVTPVQPAEGGSPKEIC